MRKITNVIGNLLTIEITMKMWREICVAMQQFRSISDHSDERIKSEVLQWSILKLLYKHINQYNILNATCQKLAHIR